MILSLPCQPTCAVHVRTVHARVVGEQWSRVAPVIYPRIVAGDPFFVAGVECHIVADFVPGPQPFIPCREVTA